MSKGIKVNINSAKIIKEFDISFRKARKRVKSEIVKDSSPLLPMRSGHLKKSSSISQASDDKYLIWNTPYARYLYNGLLMVAPNGSAWARFNQRKTIKQPHQKLKYYKGANAKAGDKWFDKAKQKSLEKWLKIYAKGAKR